MKQLLLLPLFGITLFAGSNRLPVTATVANDFHKAHNRDSAAGLLIGSQAEPGSQKMAAAVFKSQQYCRAELKDFDFDAHFTIQSATVYFTGSGFNSVAKGNITNSSLTPIRTFMEKCAPGSIIIFDDVKVIGPDQQSRTIPGITITLF